MNSTPESYYKIWSYKSYKDIQQEKNRLIEIVVNSPYKYDIQQFVCDQIAILDTLLQQKHRTLNT